MNPTTPFRFAGLAPFLSASLFALASTLALGAGMDLDLREAVAPGDLDYTSPATRSEEGMPVGNGRMGSLVWTTPSALKFQINRVDVFGQDSSTVSFPRADSDYASGCGYVDINLVEAGDDVFTGKNFHQHLSVYDGVMTAQGKGVTARVLGWPKADVMAVEIDDERAAPEPICIDLRMLRYQMQGFFGQNYKLMTEHAVKVQTANHYATSRLDIRDGHIALTQQFQELEFYDSSAIAIGIVGRPSKARYLNESTVQLVAAPDHGKFTILIGSAASFDPKQDTASLALTALDTAAPKGFDGLAADTAAWWHDFWATGFVAMSSADQQADFVSGNYIYFMYLMNASSHGVYPPRFGGMIWYTNGDFRRWGSQYWHANTDAYYHDLLSSGHVDLMDPFYSLYFGMYDACALAARQQWDSQGIYIPEITFFNGPDRLPDNLVKEFQDLFLVRKSYEQRSPEFQFWVETMNRHSSRYNFQNDGTYVHGHLIVPTKGDGIFGHCTHFLSGAAGTASEFWQRYEFTGDKDWLRNEAYPMIKGVAEFYRNFPNVQKEADGKYHIHHVNRIESDWDSSDTPSELGAMHTIFPMAVAASEILGVDADLRPKWQDIADNLAPPGPGSGRRGNFDTTNPERRQQQHGANRPLDRGPNRPFGSFVGGGEGAIAPLGAQPELKARFLGFDRLGGFIDPEGDGGAQIFRNRLRLREGPGAIDAEHIAGLSFGIQSSLLTDTVTSDLSHVTMQVFPAWPKDWDVSFRLLARGAFVVTSAQKDGKIQFVELKSGLGSTCELANPWGEAGVTVYRDGKTGETLSGKTLEIPTTKGETVIVVPEGRPLTDLEIKT
ncbi:MAG TPA: DUF5703 domain-containing protein [Opitutaceae bacterium]|nr:DUF5703 domain-containing protein [Opitutaceae bacterium]